MSDHYHYASEVQGVADEYHSHRPSEIGAAEEHDLNMLERRVQSTESGVSTLERNLGSEVNALKRQVRMLEEKLAEVIEEQTQTRRILMEHMKNSVTLTEQVEQIARHLVAQQGRF